MRWTIDDGSRDWHPWFAWHPVELSYDEQDKVVWLEWIERRTDNCQGFLIDRYRSKGHK